MLVYFVVMVIVSFIILVLRHYNNYHFGQSGLLVDYCGSEYFRRRDSGVYTHAFSPNTYAETYVGSLTIVYHHDNSGDGDIVIAEAFCGAGRIGRKCGIFHDNDQVAINGECCSLAITIDTITFINYHDCNGDNGEAVYNVFGCDNRYRSEAGIFYDNDIVTRHVQTGSTN